MTIRPTSHGSHFLPNNVKIPVRYTRKQNSIYNRLVHGHKQTLSTIVETDETLSEDELYSANLITQKTTLTRSRTYHKLPPSPPEDEEDDDIIAQCEKKIEQKMLALTIRALERKEKKQDTHSAAPDSSCRFFLEALEEEISRLNTLENRSCFSMSERRHARIIKYKEKGLKAAIKIEDFSTKSADLIDALPKDPK